MKVYLIYWNDPRDNDLLLCICSSLEVSQAWMQENYPHAQWVDAGYYEDHRENSFTIVEENVIESVSIAKDES